MNESDWKEHRMKAVPIDDLGLCSVLNSGYVKIEGHAPIPVNNAHEYKYNLKERHRYAFEQFLIRNGIYA